MEQNEAQLSKVSAQLERIAVAGDIEESAAAETEGDEAEAEEPTSKLSAAVSIFALLATLVMVGIALFQANLDPGGAANSGMAAAFNRELVQNINYSDLYSQYGAYTDYIANSELQSQLERAVADGKAKEGADAGAQAALTQELAQAQRKAAASQRFFSLRYLNRDGTYNTDRQLGEAWSSAQQQMDLDPQPHFADADQQRSIGMEFIWLLLWLTVALCIYEIVNYFNERRTALRVSFALVATLCIGFVAVATYLLVQHQ